MARVTCLTVTLAIVAVWVSYVVYVYFVQHQPHAPLLAAIKSKSMAQFEHVLAATLDTATDTDRPLTLHSLHFGNGRSVAAAIAMHGTADILSYWHALGGDIAAASLTDGRTPLHIAATFNTAAVVHRLLSLQPPTAVHSRADNTYTALLYAVLFSQHNNSRTLLEFGADPNDRLDIGGHYSACQLAAIYSDAAMMDGLVEAGGVVKVGEGYYEDWSRGWQRVQSKREQRDEQAEAVEVGDELVWAADTGALSSAQQWAKGERVVHSKAYTALNS